MFEAAISSAVAGKVVPGALRPLDWSEIVARLTAARDMRSMFARPALLAGSFAEQAKGGLARACEAERAVNHDALGRGKSHMAISVATAGQAAVGDQGTR